MSLAFFFFLELGMSGEAGERDMDFLGPAR